MLTPFKTSSAGTAQSGKFKAAFGALWALAAGVDRRGRAHHVSEGRYRDEHHSNLEPVFGPVSYGIAMVASIFLLEKIGNRGTRFPMTLRACFGWKGFFRWQNDGLIRKNWGIYGDLLTEKW